MKLNDRIKILIRDKGWNLSTFHREMKKTFKDKTIAYLTLYRTIHGSTEIRETSLFQIATALKMPPEDIKKGTEKEEQYSCFRYNEKAQLQLLNNLETILIGKLILLPGATTNSQQDPKEKADFIKCIYVLKGKLTCVILEGSKIEKRTLKKDECHTFNSTRLHYFENNSNQKSTAILIQTPKYI